MTRAVFQKFSEDGHSPKELLTDRSMTEKLNFQGTQRYLGAGVKDPAPENRKLE
ncbi:hypothetical protein [Pseudomonas kilonensis]|uniref:hypothetical protein n=1 Tax=Pseudomonas kilonensis TaxID=132476 RepID=UPI0013CED19D